MEILSFWLQTELFTPSPLCYISRSFSLGRHHAGSGGLQSWFWIKSTGKKTQTYVRNKLQLQKIRQYQMWHLWGGWRAAGRHLFLVKQGANLQLSLQITRNPAQRLSICAKTAGGITPGITHSPGLSIHLEQPAVCLWSFQEQERVKPIE